LEQPAFQCNDPFIVTVHNRANPPSSRSANVKSANKFQLSAPMFSPTTWVVAALTSHDADCAEIGFLFALRDDDVTPLAGLPHLG